MKIATQNKKKILKERKIYGKITKDTDVIEMLKWGCKNRKLNSLWQIGLWLSVRICVEGNFY